MKTDTPLKLPRIVTLCVAVIITIPTFSSKATAQVKTGLDVLIEENFQPLAGKRIGLATNESESLAMAVVISISFSTRKTSS